MTELPKTFDPAAIEARWYAHWEREGLFRPERSDREPFTIVIPPPNVTGSLHIGHALDNTLQDILIRHARMQGKDALWMVGMDHAGIATQMVVERQLGEKQQKRTDFTRDEFVAKVWEWKAESGGQITQQLRRLGASCDWANERFTMDEGFSKAVLKVFVDLYNRKLLYRDKRLVNWDPGLKTAISDLEVEATEVPGKFWHFRYPLADGAKASDGKDYVVVATTRPETMLADMAVAVNQKDDRYRSLVEAGAKVILPITGRRVPIITDDHADPELGSGAVKITPGHDFNDFEVGKRAGFKPAEMLNMFDAEAKVVQTSDGKIPKEWLGIDRFVVRDAVIGRIATAKLLETVEDRVIQTPYGDRSGVVIEPWLTDQWYVDAETLAKPAIEAVRSGDIRVVPESWKKTWFNWLENIKPWCVSRQLWWGHQIPAWFGPSVQGNALRYDSAQIFVAQTENEAVELMRASPAYAGKTVEVVASQIDAINSMLSVDNINKVFVWRDQDVLDTWFSSALWPFATLGWPEQTEELRRHYPNDVLISGFDIIFFWDARMAMQGFEFMGERPWKTLYLHGLVRDAKGQKMSKSKGNTVDPLGLIDRFGADALRFTLAAMESQGRDIKLDEKRVEGYRNFATKLWNAARFLQMNNIISAEGVERPIPRAPINRWIIEELSKTIKAVAKALASLRFDLAAQAIYDFVWRIFCDWYIEFSKAILADGSAIVLNHKEAELLLETRAVSSWVFDQTLALLHPFMPFVTEEIWHAMGTRESELIVGKWPQSFLTKTPKDAAEIRWLIRFVERFRAARSELGIRPSAKIQVSVWQASDLTKRRLVRNMAMVNRLVGGFGFFNLTSLSNVTGSVQVLVDNAVFILDVGDLIDIAAEKARLEKAARAAEKERVSLTARLANSDFVERAKPEAIEKARADLAEKTSDAEKYRAALARLG